MNRDLKKLNALVVSCGEIHDHDHYQALIRSLPELARNHFVLTLELPRDFNPLMRKFIDKATSLYEKVAAHEILPEKAERKVDQLELELIDKMEKKYPSSLNWEYGFFKSRGSHCRKEKGKWVMDDPVEGKIVSSIGHYTDIMREVARYNAEHGNRLGVYAVDITTREMKAQQRKKNLFVEINLPKECQKAVDDYLAKAKKSAFLRKIPKEGLKAKFLENIEKEGIPLEKEQKEILLGKLDFLARLQRKDKSLTVLTKNLDKTAFRYFVENYPIKEKAGDMNTRLNSAFLDYRDRRMAGNDPKPEDRRFGPCDIKKVALSYPYHYPGPRILHWGGAAHLGEWKRKTNLPLELGKAGFPHGLTADAYTVDILSPEASLDEKGRWERRYPTDFVFESQKGLLKAVQEGIKGQEKTAAGHATISTAGSITGKQKNSEKQR
ncbi:hypothetical protein [Candidatus Methylacidiphilum infernorum]|uniref:Uncharacterized protein n=1 Tax=Methylacidiphilum infernorum (isolate V4) TaxID=481448 RepID=B3E0N1_METI4|nr:hypothetical protein [Candidatus Methylacidiphilum infernorum]ACD82785.1 Hypothetical protein Minf_0730 [Methylacidiphilum infernorum V4]